MSAADAAAACALSRSLNMQSLRNSILSYMRVRVLVKERFLVEDVNALNAANRIVRQLCSSPGTCPDEVGARVLRLVKKFVNIDAAKVTKKSDFRKDLNLDSLDRVELVMAFEQEFSIDIPEEKTDELKCCADVAKYIISVAD